MRDLPENQTPTTLAAFFGRQLRKYRTRAEYSQDQLGAQVNYTGSLIRLIEKAQRSCPRALAERADELLDAGGALIDLWILVNQEPHPGWFRPFVEHEAQATTIHVYEPQVITGLLQTEDYAYEIIRARMPESPDEVIRRNVAARIQRQEILAQEKPPRLWVIHDEAVIRRVISGPSVMRAALAHVLEIAESPRVTVQILPFSVGAHPATDGSVTLLGKQPEAAYCEGNGTARLTTDPDEYAEYEHSFELLQSMALSGSESLDLIRKVMEGYGS